MSKTKEIFEGLLYRDPNRASERKHIREGQKLINNIPVGQEVQLYEIGDKVTDENFNHKRPARVTEAREQNGYWWYTIRYDDNKGQMSARQKDLKLIDGGTE